jgi:hypothetical protein
MCRVSLQHLARPCCNCGHYLPPSRNGQRVRLNFAAVKIEHAYDDVDCLMRLTGGV